MVRSGPKSALTSCVLSLCLLAFAASALRAAEGALEERKPQKNSFAFRPKVGANWIAKGHFKDRYGELIQGELGLKGTIGHLGLEFSLGGLSRDGDDKVGGPPAGKVDTTVHMMSLKLTGTYEFNPLAGVKGHEGEGNIYLGGGLGFYPFTENEDFTSTGGGLTTHKDVDGFGYGVHFVVGGEYFFGKHFGLFAELQYSYIDFDRESMKNTNLYGFSTLAGISIKF